jgi:phenylpyruvate tautomerase PptA (4-oxalocrotonate tautomerase family)
MPFISIYSAKTLTPAQKETVSKELGILISILPHKTEKVLMLDFVDGHTMYNKGRKVEDCVFVDVRLYGSASFAPKKEFTEKVFTMLTDTLGVRTEDIYIVCAEYATWGTQGSLK